MNDWAEALDFNDYLAVSSGNKTSYVNTVKADTASSGSNYTENNQNITRPRSKPGSSFITLPRPKSVIPSRT